MPSEVSPVGRDQSVEELRRELAEAREQQAATSEVLRVISRSPTDVQPVFDTILSSAVRLLGGYSGVVGRIAADQIELAAFTSIDAAGDASLRAVFPQSLNSETAHARAVRARAPINIADTQTDPDTPEAIRASARARGYRSWLTVPLLRDDEAVGTIAVTRREAGGFSDDEISLLQTFADQAVIAIENTRLFEAEQARTKEVTERWSSRPQRRRYWASSAAHQPMSSRCSTPLRGVLRDCARQSTVSYIASMVSFSTLWRTTALLGKESDAARRAFPAPPSHGSLAGRAVLSRDIAQIADIDADAGFALGAIARAAGYRSAIAVPMLRDGLPIGAIALGRSQLGLVPTRQVDLLNTFADQAVIAIENTRLFEAEQASKRELQKVARVPDSDQ